jgi:hypothetical protein
MSFLLGTSIKMVFCYLILKPILHIVTYNNTIEKVNFFGMFILFVNRDCFNDTNKKENNKSVNTQRIEKNKFLFF